jgi:UDPglucose 6-dehydrogenase
MALPTPYHEGKGEYEKEAIVETLEALDKVGFSGLIVIKSTVEPQTVTNLSNQFGNLAICHNPEFLTERTALDDFNNQSHIVLGIGPNCTDDQVLTLENFYREIFPASTISVCTSTESESMKLFANSFYSVKIQFFNELYLLCQTIGCSFDQVTDLMIKNGWINQMHTKVPGPDGKLSYGGSCFPKDTNALLNFMKRNNTPSSVLESTILERNSMRPENTNVINS